MFEAFIRFSKSLFKLRTKCGYCNEKNCVLTSRSQLQNYKYFVEPDYVPRKVIGMKYIDFESVVEFV